MPRHRPRRGGLARDDKSKSGRNAGLKTRTTNRRSFDSVRCALSAQDDRIKSRPLDSGNAVAASQCVLSLLGMRSIRPFLSYHLLITCWDDDSHDNAKSGNSHIPADERADLGHRSGKIEAWTT